MSNFARARSRPGIRHGLTLGCARVISGVIAISPMKKLNLIGQQFSKLTVVAPAPSRRRPNGRLLTAWLCRCECGNEKEVNIGDLRRGYVRSCGCLKVWRKGPKSPCWRGGRTLQYGYVRLTCPVEFPGAERVKGRHVFEHTVVVARHLGRPLHKGETIHHKNGIRDDNDIKNLELRVSNHGPGQRVEDLVVWAKEVLARYNQPIASPCCV